MKLLIIFSYFLIPIAQAFEFTNEEKQLLEKGEFVVTKENIDGKAWPRVTIFAKIKSTPKEAMAIFAAFDHQKNYVPNILVSDVVEQPEALITHTKYEMYMPWPLSNSKYIHGTKLSKNEEDYKIEWFLVESNVANNISGHAHFSPFAEGESLLHYETHVEPKSFLAGMFSKTMVKDVIDSLEVIKKTIENETSNKTEVLLKYLTILDQSFEGKKTYLDAP